MLLDIYNKREKLTWLTFPPEYTKLTSYNHIQSAKRLSSGNDKIYIDVVSNTSFVIVFMEPLGGGNPFCSLSLCRCTICLSLYLPLVMCSPHLQIHLFLHPIIAYTETGEKTTEQSARGRFAALSLYLPVSLTRGSFHFISGSQKDNRTERELKQAEQKALCWGE